MGYLYLFNATSGAPNSSGSNQFQFAVEFSEHASTGTVEPCMVRDDADAASVLHEISHVHHARRRASRRRDLLAP